jgi:Flp pilus assembly protein TadD
MRISILSTLALVFLLGAGCGMLKKPDSNDSESLSKADYAYIQKFHEGVRYMYRGLDNEAVEIFLNCYAERPSDDAVCYALSELYLSAGDQQRAGEFMQKAAKIDPKNTHYASELAYFYFDSERYKEAVNSFEKLVQKEPRNAELQFALAEAYAQSGKPKRAIEAINQTEGQMGVIPQLSVKKYQLYMRLNDPKSAVNELKIAQAAHPDDPQVLGMLVDHYFKTKQEAFAISTLEDMAIGDPMNGRVHLFLAEVYRQKGDRKAYIAALKKAFLGEGVELDSKMQALITMQETGVKVGLAELELVEILEIRYPEEAKTYSIKGDFFMQMNREDEALKAYKKALVFEKNAYPIWNQVMVMEYQRDKMEELFATSKECLSYFPSIPTPYLLNGVAANQLKKYTEAKNSLESGQAYLVNDYKLQAEFYAQLAEAEFGLNNKATGVANFEKAMELDTKSALIPNNFAYRLASEKYKLELALELANKSIAAGGKQGQFLDTKGFVYFQQGEYNKALEIYLEAIEKSKSDAVLYEHLGDCYSKLGNKTKANEAWLKAKELKSKSKTLTKKIETGEYVETSP